MRTTADPITDPLTLARPGRAVLNKVPEVTAWFWIIKILCTTVGESFADYVNETLGFGLTNTMILFTAIFAVVLTVQMRTRRYRPFAYWLTVVVVSVAGTLYTDMGTDRLGVPLWVSTSVFAALLAAVFGVWWLRERTLSIHSITTTSREGFYWLTVLVTFALGTAAGDWTLQLTNWSPGHSVLLPLALIAAIAALWRAGANPVLSFWLAYVLTRPLGANIGDWLALPRTPEHAGDPTGLGLGTFTTSLVFLAAILATVVYLTVSRRDVTERTGRHHVPTTGRRERLGLAGFVAVALVAAGVMTWAHQQPHQTCDPSGASETMPACARPAFTPAQAHSAVAGYRHLARTAIAQDRAGDTAASHASVQRLRDRWDADATSLQAVDKATWTTLDTKLDEVLASYAIDHGSVAPAPATQQEQQLAGFITDLQQHRF